jgi:PAS domain S-box-containing protein
MMLTLYDLSSAAMFSVPALAPLAARLITAAQPVPDLILVAAVMLVLLCFVYASATQRVARERHALARARIADADRRALVERSDALLAQKSHVLEVTLESLSQGVMSIDAEGRVNAFNRRALDLLQLPEALLQQRPTLDALARWQIAHGHFGTALQQMDAVGRDGLERFVSGDPGAIVQRYQRVRADGIVLDVQSHFAPDGSLVRTYSDVTDSVQAQRALAESESRFRTMADGAPALIWQSDADGRPVWFNQRWLEHTGRALADELALSWRDRLHADDYARCRAAFAAAFATRSRFEIEFRLVADDGRTAWIADTGVPRRSGDGRFEGYICYGWHIGERKAAEAALIAARDDAERANRVKSDFLSRMSHELRTPLNAVLGFGQLLETDRAEPLTPSQRARVQEILRGGRHLLTLINEVLDIARMESGALQLKLAPVALAPLLAEGLRQAQPMAAERAVTLVGAAPSAGDGCVEADGPRLEQVLLNLLTNAIRHSRAGASVHLSCDDEGATWRLAVRDEGPGIGAAQQQRLFQAFERLEAAQGPGQGAGLGLALSKWLIDLMKGEIGVSSELGRGSTFWVRLAKADGNAGPPAAAPAAVPAAATPARTRTVLYIEDNPVNLVLMEGMLNHCPGVQLLTAERPEAGLALAAEARPDLVLLDIQLPGMDGFEVRGGCRATRRRATSRSSPSAPTPPRPT